MGESKRLVLYAGGYGEDVADAMKDFAALKELHHNGELGDYDGGILTKEPSGHLILSDADNQGRYKKTFNGAFIGTILGVVFPPSVLGMAALGAGAGAVLGNADIKLSRADIKSLGDLLAPGTTGVVFVTDKVTAYADGQVLSRAQRRIVVDVDGDEDEILDALRAAVE